MFGRLLGFPNASLKFFRKRADVANDTQSDVIAAHPFDLTLQGVEKQLKEKIDFGLRPVPIFAAEREQGENLDALTDTFFNRAADTGDAGTVTDPPRLATGLGPTAIAVHDDGNVNRHIASDRQIFGNGVLCHHGSTVRPTSGLFP